MSSRQRRSEFNKIWIAEALFRVLGALAPRRGVDGDSLGPDARILVLQLQQLGDSVVFTSTLRSIRRRYPNARIDLLCSRTSARFYEKCPHIDRIWLADWFGPNVNWSTAWEQLRELRRERYDVAITDVTQVSARYPVISFLTGAKARIGFDVDDRGFLLTKRLTRPDSRNFIQCNLEIATALDARAEDDSPEAYFDDADQAYVEALIGGLPAQEHLVAIHAASNWQSKTWFGERWVQLAESLQREHGARLLFVGTDQERTYIDTIVGRVGDRAVSVVGRTTLPQLAALLSSVDLFIGTDSGPRHVAAGTGTPRVILMSAQDRSERWQFADAREIVLRTEPPCSPCFQVYCSHRQCMAQIDVNQVIAAARSLLNRGDRRFNHTPSVSIPRFRETHSA